MKLTLLKGLALFQIVLALIECFRHGLTPEGGSDTLAAALALFFIAREAEHDERVELLKLRAVNYGLIIGLTVLLLWNGMMAREWPLPTISAFNAMSLVMLAALGMFYYWRWQDGRVKPAD
jgi:hypothetical protein